VRSRENKRSEDYEKVPLLFEEEIRGSRGNSKMVILIIDLLLARSREKAGKNDKASKDK